MIPIKLELQGLYSYKEKQTIDFAQLTAAGLFGIFGAVGSGKSSILEAIMLSLYGNTERLAARGEKTSMVNLQSEVLFLSFEFRAGKNNGETYKGVYISKRNKKNFDDVKPAEHSFYQRTLEGWTPIDRRAEEIVGMKMEHFRQTVIIPQGKFRDFVEQKPLARAEMMKELFGLERFDLSAQTGSLLRKISEEKIRLQTQLQALGDISLEIKNGKETLLQSLGVQKTEQEKKLQSQEIAYNHLKGLQEKHQQWLDLKNRAQKLEAEKAAIEKKRAELSNYQKAVAFIKPLLMQLKENEIETEKYEVSFKECSRWKIDYEERLDKLEAEEQKLKSDQSKKAEREAKIRDLQKIIEINFLEKELTHNQMAVDQLLPQSKNGKSILLRLQQEINELERQEEKLQAPDAQVLADLKNMVREFQQLEEAEDRLAKEINDLTQKKTLIESKLTGLKQLLPEKSMDFEEWINQQNSLLEEQHQQKEKLIQQQGLMAYTNQVNEGDPCPLCGSMEHPAPLSHHFDDEHLTEISALIQQSKNLLETIRKNKESWEKETFQLDALTSQLNRISLDMDQVDFQRTQLTTKLKNLGIEDKESLLVRLENSEKDVNAQQQFIRQLKKLRQDLKKQTTRYEEDEKQLRQAEQKLVALQATLFAQKGEIKLPEFSFKYLGFPEGQITQDIEKVKKAIDELEVNLKRNQDKLKEARQQQATNLANLQSFKRLLSETKEKYAFLQTELARKVQENGFSQQEEAIQLLKDSIDPKEWEREIKTYENQVEITKDRLRELSDDQEVTEFKEETFKEISDLLKLEKEAFEQVKVQHTLLLREVEEIKIKLQQKEALNLDLDKVEKREMNLRELEKLFKGHGFVKFMSSIYLKELCHTANRRFMKLTKNSLSLEIDEDNNFWVRDYLNGGKKRLLKSLSGGQTFQASLCLALALAEKVKSLNRADQSFFFLDEGFGALDKLSLRTVFEALKTLRHENRVVGIISHVEELQQEIEVYAKVELDGERGSLVSYSF